MGEWGGGVGWGSGLREWGSEVVEWVGDVGWESGDPHLKRTDASRQLQHGSRSSTTSKSRYRGVGRKQAALLLIQNSNCSCWVHINSRAACFWVPCLDGRKAAAAGVATAVRMAAAAAAVRGR